MDRWIVGVAVMLVLAAAGIGCGGGDETSSSLSKVEFIKQGDAICKKGNEASRTELEDFAAKNGFDEEEVSKKQTEEAVSEVMVPNLQRQAEELGELGPPKGDEDEVEAIIVSIEEAVAEIEKDPSSFLGETVLSKPIRLENAYGFKICGGG